MASAQDPTMKQWTTDYTGLASLKQDTVPVPDPREGQVLIKVNAVSLNFRDVEGKSLIVLQLDPPNHV